MRGTVLHHDGKYEKDPLATDAEEGRKNKSGSRRQSAANGLRAVYYVHDPAGCRRISTHMYNK